MTEYELAKSLKERRLSLGLFPSHVDALCGFLNTCTTKNIEKDPRGRRPLVEHAMQVLKDFEIGRAQKLAPSENELQLVLNYYAKNVVFKHHRGRPIDIDGTYEGMYQSVIVSALPRLKKFKHGGKKNICEFVYMSCYYALKDMQREHLQKAVNKGIIEDTRSRKTRIFDPINYKVYFSGGSQNPPSDSLAGVLRQKVIRKYALPDTINGVLVGKLMSEIEQWTETRFWAWHEYAKEGDAQYSMNAQQRKNKVVRQLARLLADEKSGLDAEHLFRLYRFYCLHGDKCFSDSLSAESL